MPPTADLMGTGFQLCLNLCTAGTCYGGAETPSSAQMTQLG